jgi:hypothetical protein
MKLTVDDNNRLALPEVKPGDVFEVQLQGEGEFILKRIGKRKKPTPEEVKKALDNWSAKCPMTWEELRAMTREP